MAVAERVFIEVALQKFLTDGMIHASHAALDEAPKAFDGIGVNVSRDVNSGAVVDSEMRVAALAGDGVVCCQLIGVDGAGGKHELMNVAHERLGCRVGYDLGDYPPLASTIPRTGDLTKSPRIGRPVPFFRLPPK